MFDFQSVGQGLNQPDSPDFAWRTKNLLWDELNVLKRKLNVKSKKTVEDYQFEIMHASLKCPVVDFRK